VRKMTLARLAGIAELHGIENDHLAAVTRLAFHADGRTAFELSDLEAMQLSGKSRSDRAWVHLQSAALVLGLRVKRMQTAA